MLDSPASPEQQARLTASIDNWKRKLLDLSKRNRLLHFRTTKVSTITVVDELPAEVFRRLYLAGKPMRFKAAPDTGGARTLLAEDVEDVLLESAGDDVAEGMDFVPYDPAAADGRHTDEWLQTSADQVLLDRALRRIDEQARLTVEEQGVNTLFLTLGMLHYTESADSDEVFRGPLIMLPVQLSRTSARAGYELRIGDDEPMVNPALAEYLRRMNVTLPPLPDSEVIPDDYDLQQWFAELDARVEEHDRWSVRTDIYLGLFSFQKYVMFKDLEANAEAVKRHRLPQQLVSRAGGGVVGMPEEIRRLDLDAEVPPETSFQVVDADSSQLRAMTAAVRGYDLVIEGPPGTGKSQTITNLIAQALAANKSVLFVAEKMAALSVVHARLVKAGLGEFCLELHSSRANKRQVMQDLAQALDLSLQPVATTLSVGQRLPDVRRTLTDYVRALHEPFGTLRATPYRGYGELGAVRNAPALPFTRDVMHLSDNELQQTIRDLDDLATASAPIGVPRQHPWRDTTRTFYTELDLEQVASQADAVMNAVRDVVNAAARVSAEFGVPEMHTSADAEAALQLGAVIARSPGAALEVLRSEAWNAPPPAAQRIIEIGREMARHRGRVTGWFRPEVFEQEHRDDVAFMERKGEGASAFLAFLDGRYRAVRRRWLSYRLPSYAKSLADQANDMKAVDRVQSERTKLRQKEEEARQLFGALWKGDDSNWDALASYVSWVVEFRSACVRHGAQALAFERAAQPSPDTAAFTALRNALDTHVRQLAQLRQLVGLPDTYFVDAPLSEVSGRVSALRGAIDRGPQWAAFERARQAVAAGVAEELLEPALAGSIATTDLSRGFRRAFWMKWLAAAVRERAPLEKFHALTHEQRVAEFRDLDRAVLRENQGMLKQRLRDAAQERLNRPDAQAALPFLQKQMVRQRAIAPLRRTMKQAGAAVRAIKPCFMMSPMTVAQLLDGDTPAFDIIVFDEASQLPTEDAIGAVIRGSQLVVVGDPKQLPPTNFFAAATGQVSVDVDADGNPLFDDAESILEEFMGAGVPMSRLKWHYRSAHESLIAFSNVSFYDADLYTFPSIDTDTSQLGLQFVHLPDGRYEGRGLNAVEARRVADEVVQFAREQLANAARGEPALSLGVGTFNMRQQLAIQDELEVRRREDPSIEPFFDRAGAEPFFVKNLENIQGDERDVIFLSVTYGPGSDGRIRYNFGPLNGANGWRRLNVLVTRARQRMRVFSSMKGEEINPDGAVSQGPRLLREFLTYAQRGRLDGRTVTSQADTESPFEREVLAELMSRGVNAVPQVGTSGYRIDIGVLDDEVQGRFLLGIECDGVAYHSSETARDRDRLRQQVLELRGWTIHRVWSTDWFKDRKGEIERLMAVIERERVRSREQDRTQRAARAQAVAHAEEEARRRTEQEQREREELGSAVERVGTYTRPAAPLYVAAPGQGRHAGQDILAAPETALMQAIRTVVDAEAPLHVEDLCTRVAGMWSTRVGARVKARILGACVNAERAGLLQRRGDFCWNRAGSVGPRTRAGVRTSAERIAPEEYRATIMAVLASGHSFPLPQLVTEVRTVLGFSRTGAALDEAIRAVVESMRDEGLLGESSAGIRLRALPPELEPEPTVS